MVKVKLERTRSQSGMETDVLVMGEDVGVLQRVLENRISPVKA